MRIGYTLIGLAACLSLCGLALAEPEATPTTAPASVTTTSKTFTASASIKLGGTATTAPANDEMVGGESTRTFTVTAGQGGEIHVGTDGAEMNGQNGTIVIQGGDPAVGGTFVIGGTATINVGNGINIETGDVQTAQPVKPASVLRKVTYLGVVTRPIDEATAKKLKLPEGVGLFVDFVDPNSPAAGVIGAKDVISKLNDQIIVNQPQLAVLVRMHKPGDAAKITILREGKEQVVSASLGEKEMMVPNVHDWRTIQPGEMQIPEHVRKLMEQHGGHNGGVIVLGPGDKLPEEMQKFIAEAQKGVASSVSCSTAMTSTEDGVKVTVTMKEDQKTATIVDKNGKTVFDGPINTKEDLDKVPAEYRSRIEKMNTTVKMDLGKALINLQAATQPETRENPKK